MRIILNCNTFYTPERSCAQCSVWIRTFGDRLGLERLRRQRVKPLHTDTTRFWSNWTTEKGPIANQPSWPQLVWLRPVRADCTHQFVRQFPWGGTVILILLSQIIGKCTLCSCVIEGKLIMMHERRKVLLNVSFPVQNPSNIVKG